MKMIPPPINLRIVAHALFDDEQDRIAGPLAEMLVEALRSHQRGQGGLSRLT